LLGRLRDWQDDASWTRFFDTYGPIILAVAVKSGLNTDDAEEVVQETSVAVAKQIQKFDYDPGKGAFKSWLLTIARSKIVDRWRQQQRRVPIAERAQAVDSQTTLIERLPDQNAIAAEEIWDEEWRSNLMEASRERLKASANPRHFQVFDCLVNKGWEPAIVAEKLNVKVDQVYVIKQRMTAQLKDEVDRLRREWGEE
jgi:RNA polymerase sigma-70 factor (ECF subfamily)